MGVQPAFNSIRSPLSAQRSCQGGAGQDRPLQVIDSVADWRICAAAAGSALGALDVRFPDGDRNSVAIPAPAIVESGVPILLWSGWQDRVEGMVDWGHAAGLDNGVHLEWIETWLKGVDTGLQKTSAPMHLGDPGIGLWTNLSHFPMAAESTRWFFGPAATLNSGVPQTNDSEQPTLRSD